MKNLKHQFFGVLFVALNSLQDPQGLSMSIKKESTNSLLGGKTKVSEGTLYLKKGKLRMELNGTEKTVLVIDASTIWLETRMVQDSGEKIIVNKSKKGVLGKDSLFEIILNEKNINRHFTQKEKQKLPHGQLHLTYLPKTPNKNEIQNLEVWLAQQNKRIEKIKYQDDKENTVTYTLGEPKKLTQSQDQLFKYIPPKESEVTEF
ncbi:MAG: outer membrane lipoprotein carrier protein LolA [Bdellovibrionales bacterium]|nr:outer membrane lipoprotein carrier protein LolA [Bdellovibrionales bacterium]